ncbi:MAG: 6-bladed beta-propeller [Mediterranea massiliensis]|nr:6-bladed beta-propeller [Mediterranea massiliensis]
MKPTHCIYALSFVCLLSCNNKSKQTNEATETSLPVINLSENISKVEGLPLSDAASGVELIKLDSSDKALFSEIGQLEITDSDIFILAIQENIVFRFDRTGKMLNKIGQIGQGPGEYNYAWSFVVKNDTKEIYILTTSLGIYVYDFDGIFKRKVTKESMDQMFTANEMKFRYAQQRFFLLQNLCVTRPISSDSLWSIALVDTAFKKKKIYKNPSHVGRETEIIENRAELTGWKNYWAEKPTVTDVYNEEFTLKFPDTDTIYRYDSTTERFLPQYAIYTQEAKGDYGDTHARFKTHAGLSYFNIINYWPSKDYIYLRATKGESILTYAYEKSTGAVRIVEQECKLIEQKHRFISQILIRYEGELPFAFKNDFYDTTFNLDYTSSGKYWVDVVEPEDEDANPHLMIATLK